jgi:hypothetical protein
MKIWPEHFDVLFIFVGPDMFLNVGKRLAIQLIQQK